MAEASGQALATQHSSQENRVQQLAQKTVLLGELAVATSHQFNNIMMAVTSYVEVELKKAPSSTKRSLELILNNASRAAALVQKLFALSRSDSPFPQLVQLNSVIGDLSEVLRLLAGVSIKVRVDLQGDLPKIRADVRELEELLMSLMIHILGTTTIGDGVVYKTLVVKVASGEGDHVRSPRPGSYVALSLHNEQSIRDAAQGTERRTGDGQMDALRCDFLVAAINRSAENVDGFLKVNRDARGNAFYTVYFPVAQETQTDSGRSPIKAATTAKTILVVEDDDAVRVPATEFLKMEGFKVLQAKSGQEAIEIAEKNSGLDLLISDIMMPEMSGREVAKELRRSNPGLRVLFMSGDDSPVSTPDSEEQLLHKPFRLEKLNDKIRALLEGRGGAS
jgi:two-component system cell cycle sensor histidine kinase/response regulator CckA